jgi:hypothetical protein
VRILAEQILDDLLHARNARRAADEHHFVDLRGSRPASASACLVGRRSSAEVFDELLELRARQLHLQVLGTALIRGDERQVDVALHHRRELHLRLLRRFLQALQRHAVLAQIDAVALFELRDDPFDDALIEVVAAQMRVAVGRLDLDDPSPTSRIEMSNVPPPKS